MNTLCNTKKDERKNCMVKGYDLKLNYKTNNRLLDEAIKNSNSTNYIIL